MNNDSAREKEFRIKKGAFVRVLILVFLLGIAVSALFITLYYKYFEKGNFLTGSELEYYKNLEQKYSKYSAMQDVIERNSLYETDASGLDKSLSEAVLSIVTDDYSKYYTPSEYEQFERKYMDSYRGIGVAIQKDENDDIMIVRVIEGGPAEAAGLLPGDIIVSIDENVPKELDEASKMMTGDPGTKVLLVIRRDGVETEYTMYIQEIEEKSVTYDRLYPGDKIGYVRIASFREGTSDEFEAAVKALKSDGYTDIIVDLRGNAGGVASEGIKCADLLLPACKIITIRNRQGEETIHNSDGAELGVVYVVLVDGDTGSASEIMAGAIKDNHGGKLVGTTTYGKGLIQTLYKMTDGSVIKITTEEYILPGGSSIHGVGIEPDVVTSEGEDPLEAARAEILASR